VLVIFEWGRWRSPLLHRLRRQVSLTGDPELSALALEAESWTAPSAEVRLPAQETVAPLRLQTADGELAFLSTITTFGTAVEITTSELSIESFFPADATTAQALRSRAGNHPRPAP
jgi:hypothetical protein